jgi:hypothetical protein
LRFILRAMAYSLVVAPRMRGPVVAVTDRT